MSSNPHISCSRPNISCSRPNTSCSREGGSPSPSYLFPHKPHPSFRRKPESIPSYLFSLALPFSREGGNPSPLTSSPLPFLFPAKAGIHPLLPLLPCPSFFPRRREPIPLLSLPPQTPPVIPAKAGIHPFLPLPPRPSFFPRRRESIPSYLFHIDGGRLKPVTYLIREWGCFGWNGGNI